MTEKKTPSTDSVAPTNMAETASTTNMVEALSSNTLTETTGPRVLFTTDSAPVLDSEESDHEVFRSENDHLSDLPPSPILRPPMSRPGGSSPLPLVTVGKSGDRRRLESTKSEAGGLSMVDTGGSLAAVLRSSADDFKRSSSRGPRRVRKYYRRQSELISNYAEDSEVVQLFEAHHPGSSPRVVERFIGINGDLEDETGPPSPPPLSIPSDGSKAAGKRDRWLAKISLAANVLLLIAKTVAVILSGSLSIVSSLVDSAVDITSGLVIWLTSRAIKNRDPYLYPRGRTRLEPLALVIISVVMAVASVQVIVQSTEAMVRGRVEPDVGLDTVLIMVATILIKAMLAAACMYWGKNRPSLAVLAQDHRNDCLSNSAAIVCAYLAAAYWPYLDPIGAIAVSLYIASTWFYTGYGQIAMLSGRSAKPAYINRILKISLEHDDRIQSMDTVYVYHYGTKYLVEVHVVMDQTLSLKEAHDVSEPLQQKLEALPYVERAFVHVDYECDHRPEDEHKVV